MKLEEIKKAVDEGKTVHWKQDGYIVIKGKFEYLVKYIHNNHCIGLTWLDGITMNGEEKDFYVKGEK